MDQRTAPAARTAVAPPAARAKDPPASPETRIPRMSRSTRIPLLTAVLPILTALALPLQAQTPANGAPGAAYQADSAAVAATVERYHQALASADSAAALALLSDDAVILESGGVETRDEYRSHHLSADVEFARAIRGTRGPVRVRIRGDVAWASSTSVTQGEFRGRQINSAGAELMVLMRTPQGWRITAIHWSSRNRR